jgi:hypothetical protein
MKVRKRVVISSSIVVALLALSSDAAAQQEQKDSMAGCPMHAQHMAEMNQRGDRAMGFDHMKTTHHFRLLTDGGAIEVTANDPKDTTSRDQIRQHLAGIAKMFASGDFAKPLAVHAEVPPGADALSRLKGSITYTFEATDGGGRVRIKTGDSAALAAVHAFLRFQITEHQTGDPMEVAER